jgi:hypothetical protein
LKLKIPPELENFDAEAFQRSQAQPQPEVISSCPNPVAPGIPSAHRGFVNPWASAPAPVPSANQAFVNPWSAAPVQPAEPTVTPAAPATPAEIANSWIAAAQEPPPPVSAAPAPAVVPETPPAPQPDPWGAPAHTPAPVYEEPHLVLSPSDVQFGGTFDHQLAYNPFMPQEAPKVPRWLIATMGTFFGVAAVLMVVVLVALLRDPKPAPPTVQLVVPPPAPVATAPVAPAPSAAPVVKAPAPEVRPEPAVAQRVAVSRHPAVVRRPSYGSRRIAHQGERSSPASEESAPSRPPPQDDLDRLLSQSSP